MASQQPFFSVIMACRDAGRYIEESIRSVLNQTCTDWELIIVDDASNDESYVIANAFSKIDERIRIFRSDNNRGAGFSRNMAIEHAIGKWLAILDADDLFLPTKLERQRDFITSYHGENLVLLGTGVIKISDDGGLLKTYSYPKDSIKLKRNLYAGLKFPPHSSIAYLASAVKSLGGFNSRFLRSQDYDLWIRLSEKGEFSALKAPMIKYRVHKCGISVNRCSSGYTQPMYGAAANVCWRLRKVGFEDPSKNDRMFNELMRIAESTYVGSKFEKADMLMSQLKMYLRGNKLVEAFNVVFWNPFTFLFFLCCRLGFISYHNNVMKVFKIQNPMCRL